MRVVTQHLRTYPEDPTRYLAFDRFAGQTRSDFCFFAGMFDFRALDAIAPEERVVYLELEEPNRFLVRPGTAKFHHLDRDGRWDRVFTLCPYTAAWLNRRYGTNRWSPVFFPFNEQHIPAPQAKDCDVIYTGDLQAAPLQRLVGDLSQFNHRVVSQTPGRRVTHPNCSYFEKLDLIARARITLVHNLLFPDADQVRNLARHAGCGENPAFALVAPPSSGRPAAGPRLIPQLKSRLFEAAFCRSLILCQRDPWNLVETFFEPGREFVYFEPENLADTIREILRHYGDYAPVIEQAHARACRQYTTRAFFDRYLRDLTFEPRNPSPSAPAAKDDPARATGWLARMRKLLRGQA